MTKHILAFTLALILSAAAFGQNATEVAYQSAHKMEFRSILVDDDSYYLGSDNWHGNSNFSQSNKLVKTDKAGAFIWEREFAGYSNLFFSGIYKQGSEIWSVSNQMTSCDAISNMRAMLVVIDETSSAILSEKIILTSGINIFSKCKSIQLLNGNLVIAMGDSLAAVDGNTNILWKKELNAPNDFFSIAEGLNGEILLGTSNGVDIYNSTGDFISNSNVGFRPVTIRTVAPSAYLLASTSGVYICDAGFGIVAQQSLTSYLTIISDAYLLGSNVYVSGTNATNNQTASIVRLDNSLGYLNSADIEEAGIHALALDGDTILAIGQEDFYHHHGLSYHVYGSFLKAYDTDLSSNNYQNDGEITEIVMDSSYVENSGQPKIIHSKVKVKVKNNGQETIRRVSLTHSNPVVPYLCNFHFDYNDFEVNIAPGQDELIDYGWLTHHTYTGVTDTGNLCIILTSSSHLDDDHTNNVFCQMYIAPVGINEPNSASHNLTIFPNPTNSELNISFEVENETDFSAIIYDISGRQVAQLGNQAFATGKHTVSWGASTQPAGLYYCHITLGDETIVKKVSVVR